MPLKLCKSANFPWSTLGDISRGHALSPLLAEGLREAGHEASHVHGYRMAASADDAIFELAAREERAIVSADTDFAGVPSLLQETRPAN
jgi:predicted nuclease of predicted toxin-antitoxin system